MHYLGVANYMLEHFPLMATAVASLNFLCHVKDLSSVWKPVHEDAFEHLKSLLQDLPPLTFFDDSVPVFVATDASNVGLGAVLYKGYSVTGKLVKIVSYQTHSLKASEKNYSATCHELLGIVYALQKFHCWLYGRSFTLFTDNQALVYMHSQRQLNPLLAGWLEILLHYDFYVVHCPGVRNILPDHLSWLFPASLWEEGVVSEDTESQVAIVESWHEWGHYSSKALAQLVKEEGFIWPGLATMCEEVCKQCQNVRGTTQVLLFIMQCSHQQPHCPWIKLQ
jgi:hypothetical protein